MTHARRVRTLSLALVVAAFGFAATPTPRAHAGWWDDLDKGESVTLSDLCAEPVRWRDKVVTFTCIYNQPDEIYQPYFTSFNAEKYENVTAWLDGSPLWEAEAFQRDDFPYLYLPRNHAQRTELFRLPPFTRIEITGKVKDVYKSRPWIAIQAFRVTAATLGKAVIDYVKSGDGYAAQGNYVNAEAHYRRALEEIKLADVYRTRIQKRLAEVLRAAGKGLEANKVEGPGPILGADAPPLPPSAATGLPDARTPATPAAPVAPPSELTTDLPGDAGAPPRAGPIAPASPFLPAIPAAPSAPAIDPGLRPVTPPAPGSIAPPSELTTDLPGTPSSAGAPPLPAPAYPSMRPPPEGPSARLPSDSASAVPPTLPTPAGRTPVPAAPAAPAPAPSPEPLLPPLPAAPAIAPPVPAAPTAPSPAPVPESPPPPPSRQPRLSGVK